MHSISKKICSLILLFIIGITVNAQPLEKQFDQLLAAEYKIGQPGAAALVAKDEKLFTEKHLAVPIWN